jgi:hypothetical protein
MAYPFIVASVALSFVSFPSAAQPLFDQASSASGLMHLAQMRVPNCKGVKRAGVSVPVCCVRGSAAGCVADINECKSRGGSPNSDGAKGCDLPASLGGTPAAR